MKIEIVSTDQAPAAIGAYSQGMVVGELVYFSGQIGIDPISSHLRNGFDGQLEQILKNINYLLTSIGLTPKHVIKTTVFMTNLGEFSKVNAAYEKFFSKPFPARSTVEVRRLPKDAEIEIEVMAVKNI